MYGEPWAEMAEKEDGMPSKAMDAEPPQFDKNLLNLLLKMEILMSFFETASGPLGLLGRIEIPLFVA